MRTRPLGTELMERYLRSRRLRYFRGHHDGEYFFILTVGRERLHVHLDMLRGHRYLFTIRVAPAYYFPATHRAGLVRFANKWNRDNHCATASVHESSDPSRVGVVVENSHPIGYRPDFAAYARFVDDTIQSAVTLFAELPPVGAPVGVPASPRVLETWLPDAG